MKNFLRYLSVLMCTALIMSSVPVFADGDTPGGDTPAVPTPTPTASATSAIEETSTVDSELTPTTDPAVTPTVDPVVTPTADTAVTPTVSSTETASPVHTESPTAGSTETPAASSAASPAASPVATPTHSPALRFGQSYAEMDITEFGADFDPAVKFPVVIENTSETALVWSSDREDIARFAAYDASGAPATSETPAESITYKLEVYSAGTITVRAALAADASVYAEMQLTISAVELILNEYQLSATEDDVLTLSVTLSDGTPIPADQIAWTSSGACAAVSDGVVKCLSAGDTVITAAWKGAQVSCSVSVAQRIVPITASSVEIYTTGTGRIEVKTADGSEIDMSRVKFISEGDNSAYFTVDAQGNISPVTTDGLISGGASSVTRQVQVSYRGGTANVLVTIKQAITCAALTGGAQYVDVPAGGQRSLSGLYELYPASHADYITDVSSTNAAVAGAYDWNTVSGMSPGQAEFVFTMASGMQFRVPVNVVITSAALQLSLPVGNLKAGDALSLGIDREPANANDALAWASSDTSIATVDENGNVTLVNPGYAVISVTAPFTGATASIELNIIRAAAGFQLYKGVFPDKTSYVLGVGKSVTPVIDVLPWDATYYGYTLVSSDESVVRVTGAKVTAVGVGYATVTATSLDGEASLTLNFAVPTKRKAITSFRLSSSRLTLYEGQSRTVKARINSSAYDKSVTWASTNPAVATVDANGKITAVAPGSATIYCLNSAGAYKSVSVKVKIQLPTKVKLNKRSGSMYPGQEYQLIATISPSTVVQPEALALSWTSSNSKVVMVTDTGYVYAIAPGTARITVTTANGKKAACRVTVKKRLATSVTIVNPYDCFQVGGIYDLDATVSPYDATYTSVKWTLADRNSRKRAKINSSTGEIYCMKAGTVKITATATDGSRKKQTITIQVVEVPLNSMSVTLDGRALSSGEWVNLEYKAAASAACSVDPQMQITWKSSNSRVASVDANGLVTATGSGTATITATAGGHYTFSFCVNVPYAENAPRYRALVIGQYQTSGVSGYLPFSVNSGAGIVDALELSDIDGSRYDVTYLTNLTSGSKVLSAINAKFADAQEGDVSVIYIMTHGLYKNGAYVWQLAKGKYLYASDVMDALAGIKGDVVIMVLSCRSGGTADNPATLTGMVSNLDSGGGAGSSYSIISASDNTKRASYVNTHVSAAYDFFTLGVCESLGWDMLDDVETASRADSDGDGSISLTELAASTQSITAAACSDFLAKYSDSAYWGPPEKCQTVTYYISPNAANLSIFKK